jgi:predicted kinase
MTPDSIEIGRLSREEKLRVMEAIWEDLSKDAEEVESPDWHREALEETESRLRAGQETVVDWTEAKKELRKRFT